MIRAVGVPSVLRLSAPRTAASMLQRELERAQVEVSTGRHYDVGLVLGAKTGASIALRLQSSELEQGISTIAQARSRAGLTQSSLDGLSKLSSSFLETLTGARGAVLGQKIASDAAKAALASFADLMNVSFDGTFVFAGLNSQTAPILGYAAGPAKTAVDTAFLAIFGIPQDDPGVSSITLGEMTAFLDGAFDDLFSPQGWRSAWSTASDTNVKVPFLGPEHTDAAVNANAEFAPLLVQAFIMMQDLGQSNLSEATFETVVDQALSLVSQAQVALANEQTRVGIVQQQLLMTSESYSARNLAVAKSIDALESVDPYEVATRVNSLMTQLEASYTLTGRISRMSLLNYI